ncbi:hypothetical protein OLX23_22470 [Novosphingobium sp. JCM 18896]|nr:hypothetical protein [Novosphingobium sp. JCM 18896]
MTIEDRTDVTIIEAEAHKHGHYLPLAMNAFLYASCDYRRDAVVDVRPIAAIFRDTA